MTAQGKTSRRVTTLMATWLPRAEARVGRAGLLLAIGLAAGLLSTLVSWAFVATFSGPSTVLDGWQQSVIPLVTGGLAAPAMTWLFLQLLDDVHRLSEDYRHLAEHDQLTGLLNRRGLFSRIGAVEPGSTLLIADIDRFKEVNDRYGHRVGDTVLIEAADQLRRAYAAPALLARIGGDEFLVVLDQEQCRRLVPRTSLPVTCREVDTTLTIGSSLYDGDLDAALAAADLAMYSRKADRLDQPEP